MKKFVFKIIGFFIFIFSLAYPMDLFVSSQLKKSNTFAFGEYPVWNDLYNGKINSDIVIYGSSRAWVHIDPSIIEKSFDVRAYNLGIDGHNFWLQYLRHKTLLEHNTKPKTIILSVDVFSLEKRKDLFNYKQFLPYMLFSNDIADFTSSYHGFSRFDYYIPLIRYFGNRTTIVEALKGFVNPKNEELGRIKGFKGKEASWNSDLHKAKLNQTTYEVVFDNDTVQLFNTFLEECENEDIEVILVYTPEFIKGQKFVKNRSEIIEFFKKNADNNNIRFLNYSKDSICYKKEYFYNSLHLNKNGAKLFTEKLILDIDFILNP